MQTATRILVSTPVWVFVLLAYLIRQGARTMRVRTQPIWRMPIVPLVFVLMGLSRRGCAAAGISTPPTAPRRA